MVRSSRFGTQPLNEILLSRKLSKRQVAEDIGVSVMHLRNSAYGYCSPKYELREALVKYLGVPAHEMFNPDVLGSRPFYGDKGRESVQGTKSAKKRERDEPES